MYVCNCFCDVSRAVIDRQVVAENNPAFQTLSLVLPTGSCVSVPLQPKARNLHYISNPSAGWDGKNAARADAEGLDS